MVELEREKTYLLKELPAGLASCRSEVISDAYIPASALYPILRLRHRGDRYELTKKEQLDDADASRQTEHTIHLTPDEAVAFEVVKAKRATKRRYYCTVDGYPAELDLYQDDLVGLVVIDFEFESDEAMDALEIPDICLADVTQDEAIAGGVLAGKTYADLAPLLQKYHYEPLYLEEAV
jgi:adenylate cyclase